MKHLNKTLLACVIAGAAALPMSSAQAWWGGPWGGGPWGGGPWGNGWGNDVTAWATCGATVTLT